MPAIIARLGTWLANAFLIPLFQKYIGMAVKAAIDYFKRKREQKKRHEENKKKVENYENASTPDSATDDFSKLP